MQLTRSPQGRGGLAERQLLCLLYHFAAPNDGFRLIPALVQPLTEVSGDSIDRVFTVSLIMIFA